MITAMLCVNLVNLGQLPLILYQIIRINIQLVPGLSSRICEVSNRDTVQKPVTLLHLCADEFLDLLYFLYRGKSTTLTLLSYSNLK